MLPLQISVSWEQGLINDPTCTFCLCYWSMAISVPVYVIYDCFCTTLITDLWIVLGLSQAKSAHSGKKYCSNKITVSRSYVMDLCGNDYGCYRCDQIGITDSHEETWVRETNGIRSDTWTMLSDKQELAVQMLQSCLWGCVRGKRTLLYAKELREGGHGYTRVKE